MLLALFGCVTDTPVDATAVEPSFAIDPVAPAGLVALDAPRLLRRMSLDLRGVLPSTEELDTVEADPTTVDTWRDAWLDDPRLEERLVRLFAEAWHTRVDEMPLVAADFGLDEDDEYTLARSAGEEPLRLLAHIVVTDRPWTDVVTADYTMANETLGAIWPLDYPADAMGWQEARYTDGRPALGVLATNGLWWRYETTIFNFNRTRAAAVTRLLLCDDYLLRPVTLRATPSLADVDGTELATTTEADCLACHASLDPLAVNLFGFWPFDRYDPLELDEYHPEREPLGERYLAVEAAYFGAPVNGPADLGPHLAADPRLAQCAVRTIAEALWRRQADGPEDFDQLEAIRRDFVAGGLHLKDAIRAITDTAVYRAGSLGEDAGDLTADRELTVRTMSPDLLESALADLTGWTWARDGYAQLDNDTIGYRVMAGGVDGLLATRPTWDPGVTWALVAANAARGAADSVGAELGRTPLLAGVTPTTPPDDPAFVALLHALHWRLFGTRADAAWDAEMTTLWTDVEATDDAQAAWAAVLQVCFRDPAFLSL
jgi:hypothetical protein